MAQDFAAFARKLDRTTAEFTGANKAQILKQLGQAAERDADKAARADLGGDAKFSGWPKAILTTDSTVVGDVVKVGPKSKGVGPWRVAQDGRHPGMFGPMQGPALSGFSKKTGKALKGRRQTKWNGTTAPKDTWSDAVKIMEKETPARAARAVGAALGRVWKG